MRYQLDLKAGWEVTMGERGESQKDTKGGRSSLSREGKCTEVREHRWVGPQQKGALGRAGR